MDRFSEMAVFVAVAEEGVFSTAAKRLNMSPPVVTRAVASLEDRLGIQLLKRTTRHVRVTAAGQHYVDDARTILDDLAAADESVLDVSGSPSGEVSIVVPEYFAGQFVVPVVDKFLTRYPKTQVSMDTIDRSVNTVREGVDVGIRFGDLPENVPHTVVGQFRDVYVATPAYLREHGTPRTPADLEKHTLIDNSKRASAYWWAFQQNDTQIPLGEKPRVSFSNVDGCLAATGFDFGIAQLPDFQVADEVASGRYELVLGEFEIAPHCINVVHPERHTQSTRVRAFVDLLVEHLLSVPQLQPKDGSEEDQRGLAPYIAANVSSAPQMLHAC